MSNSNRTFIDVQHLRQKLAAAPLEVLVVDVRSKEEFESGHVHGAINIPLDQIPARAGELRAHSVVTVCGLGGARSCNAADALSAAGVGDVSVLQGGQKAWADSENKSPSSEIAIQDLYPGTHAHCFGCGRLNPEGHHLKSYLRDVETIASFRAPQKYSGGVPGKAYGGLVASLLDCHGTASAAAFAARAEGVPIAPGAVLSRFVTGSLKVDFKNPTPLEVELLLRGRLRSLEGRKAWIDLSLSAGDVVCATAEMLAIRSRE